MPGIGIGITIALFALSPAVGFAATSPGPDASNLIFEFITLPAAALLIAGSPVWGVLGAALRAAISGFLASRRPAPKPALASGARSQLTSSVKRSAAGAGLRDL